MTLLNEIQHNSTFSIFVKEIRRLICKETVHYFTSDQYNGGAGFEITAAKPYAHVTSLRRSLSVVATGGEWLFVVLIRENNPSILLRGR